jgi:hypothetical protein
MILLRWRREWDSNELSPLMQRNLLKIRIDSFDKTHKAQPCNPKVSQNAFSPQGESGVSEVLHASCDIHGYLLQSKHFESD